MQNPVDDDSNAALRRHGPCHSCRRVAPRLCVLLAVLTAGWLAASDESPPPPVEADPSAALRPGGAVVLSQGPVMAPELKAADGFEATVFAGDELVHDAGCLTIDHLGRIAVSGPGYIRLLIDHNYDGRADEGVTFADGPKSGAQGLCFDGNDLLAVGDGGLLRYRDLDGDARADGPPTKLLPLKTGGEHHAHAVLPGPDGWWYLLCGNDTGVTAATITSPASAVQHPDAGVLLRFRYTSDDAAVRDIEVVADGLRNAYDFDFTMNGDPVTYDSDDEREVSLPWYRPTRVFRLTPGSHAGWISRSWKRPDAYPEMPEVLASLGRGSPTGVVVVRHEALPRALQGAVIACDWTFGRVVAIPMNAADEPGEPIELLTASGPVGFAPTDIAIGQDGSLFIAAGGRGTTGTVYRLRAVGDPLPEPQAPAAAAVPALERRRTLERLAETLPQTPPDAESLAGFLLPALADAEPNVRKAAMHAVSRLSETSLAELTPQAEAAGRATAIRFHLGRLRRSLGVDLAALDQAVAALEDGTLPTDVRYDAVRLAQIAIGDVGVAPGTPDTFSGYASRVDLAEWRFQLTPLVERLLACSSTEDDDTENEFARLLAMIQPDDAEVVARALAPITPDSHPTDDLHQLFVVSRLPGLRSATETATVADALVALDVKCAARGLRQDNNWEERLGDLLAALFAADRSLAAAVVRHEDFGRPGHALLANAVPEPLRAEAAAAFLRAGDADSDYRWTPEVVAALGASTAPDLRDRLRELAEEPALRQAAMVVLAAHPDEADRALYVAGLDEPQIEVVDASVAALDRLTPATEATELAALVSTLRRLGRDDREYAIRNRVARLLQRAIGDPYGFVFGRDGFRPQPEAIAQFVAHVRSLDPALLPEESSADAALPQLLADASALSGDAERGRVFYEARACHRCHDGGAVGPDLAGVAERFARDDLFLAIVDPDRTVSERYRGTLVQTIDGQVLSGLVVYESADGVTLKDGTRTWRIEADEIEDRRPLDVSLMPRGLLKDATGQDIADLEAYLRTLAK